VKGARRPLRVNPAIALTPVSSDTGEPPDDRPAVVEAPVRTEGGVDEHGSYITVAFALPPGSYATVLLRELMKSGDEIAPADQADSADSENEDSGSAGPDPEVRLGEDLPLEHNRQVDASDLDD
jgi:tRNA(Glu) U13 pseudouridine synthase TruD